jgi:CheY-like chemotaxis protein
MLEHLGYRVAEAGDGNQAIAMARAEQPDAILMDMSLPGLDGWSATRALKDDPATASIPVIALTAHVSEQHRGEAMSAGCDAYLRKPVAPRQVEEEVRRLIGARRAGRP